MLRALAVSLLSVFHIWRWAPSWYLRVLRPLIYIQPWHPSDLTEHLIFLARCEFAGVWDAIYPPPPTPPLTARPWMSNYMSPMIPWFLGERLVQPIPCLSQGGSHHTGTEIHIYIYIFFLYLTHIYHVATMIDHLMFGHHRFSGCVGFQLQYTPLLIATVHYIRYWLCWINTRTRTRATRTRTHAHFHAGWTWTLNWTIRCWSLLTIKLWPSEHCYARVALAQLDITCTPGEELVFSNTGLFFKTLTQEYNAGVQLC